MSAIPGPKTPSGFGPRSPIAQIRANSDAAAVDRAAEHPAAGEAPPSAATADETPAAADKVADPASAPSVSGSASGRKGGRGKTVRESNPPREEVAPTKTFLLRFDERLKERMINAMEWTGPKTGLRSQQVFIRRAISDLCEQLEKEHNAGKPFPAIAEARES